MCAKELNSLGVLVDSDNFTLVKKLLNENEKIPKHNHQDKNILFTVDKGEVLVYINETQEHLLKPGTVLSFDGNNFISAVAKETSEIFVTLINKN